MPIFCHKNVHSLKNTVLSCNFFHIFLEKPHAVMHVFGQKFVNSVKTTIYYGPGSPKNEIFSTILHEKNPYPYAHML